MAHQSTMNDKVWFPHSSYPVMAARLNNNSTVDGTHFLDWIPWFIRHRHDHCSRTTSRGWTHTVLRRYFLVEPAKNVASNKRRHYWRGLSISTASTTTTTTMPHYGTETLLGGLKLLVLRRCVLEVWWLRSIILSDFFILAFRPLGTEPASQLG